MRVEIMQVTPELAATWLKANTHNRNIVTRVVADYARDMVAGSWRLNGEAIKIAKDGTILDGQHRLLAIVEAGVSLEMLVVLDLDPETQKTMDSGRKRTLSDNLTIAGVSNSAVVAAIGMRMWMWDRGDIKLSKTVRPTQSEIRNWIDANPSVHRSAEIAARTRTSFRVLHQSTAGTAHQLFNRLDPSDTAEFFARLGSGAGLDEGHPILRLRDRLTRDAMERRNVHDAVRLGLVIKAWNAWRSGEEVGSLLMTLDNKMPTPK